MKKIYAILSTKKDVNKVTSFEYYIGKFRLLTRSDTKEVTIYHDKDFNTGDRKIYKTIQKDKKRMGQKAFMDFGSEWYRNHEHKRTYGGLVDFDLFREEEGS